jgi:hypothetical protein
VTKQQEELQKANAEQRQPICLFCQKPLDKVVEQTDLIYWVWDQRCQRYHMSVEPAPLDEIWHAGCKAKLAIEPEKGNIEKALGIRY